MMPRLLLVLLGFVTFASAASCVTDADCGTNSYDTCCYSQHYNTSTCIDTRYQTCCLNTYCNSYQTCCNITCCSAHSKCKAAEFLDHDRDTCTSIENFDVIREYTSIGVPIVLGFGALLAYIFAFVLIRTHSVRFTAPVALVIATSVWCWIWAVLLLISMHALPAVLLCAVTTAAVASLAAIAPAHAPTQVIVTTLAAIAVIFLMMINPLASNSLFSFDPLYPGTNNFGGVLGRALTNLSPEYFANMNNDDGTQGPRSCVGWYNGFWRRDSDLYTDTRIHDPVVTGETWGLCGRKYLFYIAVISTFETAGLPLLFLALVARLWEVRTKLTASTA